MGDMLRHDTERLRILLERHLMHTGSDQAKALLDDWDATLSHFVKVMPRDYRRALQQLEAERLALRSRGRIGSGQMGKVTGFLEIERRDRGYEKPEARLKNWTEFVRPLGGADIRDQAARCMDCGIPYCHNGCPVNNIIPDWNHLVYQDDWRSALECCTRP